MKFRLLTYNIHKGFTAGNRKYVLRNIKKSIHEVHADVVCLQEVIGHHSSHASRIEEWPTTTQFEFLADQIWPHTAYGKNAVYTEGHHGNAILSAAPIPFWENQDVSLNQIERRGLLHAVIALPRGAPALHVFSVHLGLFEKDRKEQVRRLASRIRECVPADAPLIVAGDFNDWKQTISPLMEEMAELQEVFLEKRGRHALTFPSWMPLLALDRLYYRNLKCTSAQVLRGGVWRTLSDHLPILGEFEL